MPKANLTDPEKYLSKELIQTLKKQHYALFAHAGCKLCHWTKESIKNDRVCYKQQFYGIESHRCMQLAPMPVLCDHRCVFCWRPFHNAKEQIDWLEADQLAKESFDGHKMLLTGFYGIPDRVNMEKLNESSTPTNIAISLAGEPTMYPHLAELISYYNTHNCNTFLVTNGVYPEVLEEFKGTSLPTQLYVSLDAPNKEIHQKVNVPVIKDSWERINKTLEIFPKIPTRKAIRITVVKDWNDSHPEQYAELIAKAKPHFIEVKGYMFVGFSRYRLQIENMPSHEEVRQFAEEINKTLGYDLRTESKPSRVVLLVRPDVTQEQMNINQKLE